MGLQRKSSIANNHCIGKKEIVHAKALTTQHSIICPKCGGQVPYILRRHWQPQAGMFEVPCSQHPGGNIAPTPATLAQVARDGSCMLIHTFKVTEISNSTDEIWDAPCFTTSYKIADTSPLLAEDMYEGLQYVRIHPGTQRATPQCLLTILSRPWCLLEMVLSYSGILESILETLEHFDSAVDAQPIMLARQVAEAMTNPKLDLIVSITLLVDFFNQAKLVSFANNWWRIVLTHLYSIRPLSCSDQVFQCDQLPLAESTIIKRYDAHSSVVYEPL
ncbi:hypothetical protein VKS41_006414 [Umbelopsis sp. WA50703]